MGWCWGWPIRALLDVSMDTKHPAAPNASSISPAADVIYHSINQQTVTCRYEGGTAGTPNLLRVVTKLVFNELNENSK